MSYTAYAIGTDPAALFALSGTPVGAIPDPYPVEFTPYTELVGTDNLGQPIYAGPGKLSWKWDRLKPAWYVWLCNFLGVTGHAHVYLLSRRDVGLDTSGFELDEFEATMWRPTYKVAPGPYYTEVEIQFTNVLTY